MEAFRNELRRLARGRARATAGRRAGRVHAVLLLAAVGLAATRRLGAPVPGAERLAGHVLPTLVAAAALLALGPLLRGLLRLGARPRERELARDLDDRHGWRDGTDTAAGIARDAQAGDLGTLVLAQASGRLGELPATAAPPARTGRALRRALVLLFVALLLLPGVEGRPGRRGAGRTGAGLVGEGASRAADAAPRPMRADEWLSEFVDNPLPVEPLPAEDAPAGSHPR
jgi:hypothetical protein